MNTRKLVLSGLFIGLTIILQIVLRPFAQTAVGPAINMMLVLSVLLIDKNYAIIVGFITPIVAAFVGLLPFVVLAPLVGIGNAMLILPKYFIKGEGNKNLIIFGIGAVLKFIVLALFANYVFALVLPKVPAPLVAAFMWPQLLNAILGTALAMFIYSFIPKQFKEVE
jgi:predicted membrane protein